jgi:hypothetical protein
MTVELFIFLFCCFVVLTYCAYQIGRVVGRGERTQVDVEWDDRIRNGYGSRT